MINQEIKQQIIDIFGERVAFHRIERMLYSTDLASLPGMITSTIKTLPDAVVQPVNTSELQQLLVIASKYKVPLVPRGSGTSGYGGAMPVKNGIVIDFFRMNKVIEISNREKVVNVEPGIIWQDLENKLHKGKLTLRMYPGSAPSSTVGGWLANGGGIGIGSFEFGIFRDNVLEVDLITCNGPVKLTRKDINLVNGMAGTTGLITSLKIQVRDLEKDSPLAAAFDKLEDMVSAFELIREKNLQLWEVGYRDPINISFTQNSIQKQCSKLGKHPVPVNDEIPSGKYLVIFAYPESRKKEICDALKGIIFQAKGELLSENIAEDEWEERFFPMRLKSSGPSIIPAEVVLPTSNLASFANRLNKSVKGMAFNGTLVNRGIDTAYLGYKLVDERQLGYSIQFTASLTAVKIARKLGGRPYTSGLILANISNCSIGKDNLLKANEFKKFHDKAGILNPGKVFPAYLRKYSTTNTLNQLLKLGNTFSSIGTATADNFSRLTKVKSYRGKTILENGMWGDKINWDSFSCVNCGYCRKDCTEFKAIGWESSSPRGKFHFIREYLKHKIAFDERMAEMFFVCSTCRHCNEVCQAKIPIDEYWVMNLRPTIWKEGFKPPQIFLAQSQNILSNHNSVGSEQSKRKEWMSPDLKYQEEGEICYWAGCSISFSAGSRNIGINTFRILNKANIRPVYLGTEEWCCGGALFTVGCHEEIEETLRHNISELKRRGVKTLISSCSSCWLNLAHWYPILAEKWGLDFDITIKHGVEYINTLNAEGKIKLKFPVNLKVTYHDPCHIGRSGGIYEPPRQLLKSVKGLELVEMPRNRENSACCARHLMRYPKLGLPINTSRLLEASNTGAKVLVGACPTCETNFRNGIAENKNDLEVMDVTDVVAESMGLPTTIFAKLTRLTGGL